MALSNLLESLAEGEVGLQARPTPPNKTPEWSVASLGELLNLLAPGKFEWNFRYVIFQGILVIDGWGISCELALRWMSFDFTDEKSTLVQVMAWCHQATSNYLSQCWPRSMSSCGVTRPQWVNSVMPNSDIDPGHHWLMWWLVAWGHQVVTWTNADFSSFISMVQWHSSEGNSTRDTSTINHWN